jgi:ABC-2 type transport system permease protein
MEHDTMYELYPSLKTAQMACLEKVNGGLLSLLPTVVIKTATLIALTYLWRVVIGAGAQTGLGLGQMLTYAYASALLSDLLVVQTPASGWLSEGVIARLYSRPASVLGQLAAQTAGGWVPLLLLFSLPMTLLAPLFSVRIVPATLWFLPSLLLCVSLGFAVDILFACLSIRLRNMNWLVGRIRVAVTALFSGTVIPVWLLPFGLGDVLRYSPFASLGGAPLSVLVGIGGVREILLLQTAWNLLLWPLALLAFRRSQERMVSYGG